MKKRAIPLAAAGLIAVIGVAGAAFALTGSGGDSEPPISRDANDRDESGGDGSSADCAEPPCNDIGQGIDAICLEGAIDCDDTIEKPVDEVCPDIYPPPPGCGDPDAPVSNEPPIVDDPATNLCAGSNSAECQKAAVALAMEDLSLRLGSPQAITVQSVEFVQWPDSCIGISKTDVACAEVITPGFKVVLAVGGQTFEYHTDTGTRAELVE